MVDSFRTVVRKALTNASEVELQGFVQRLALHLTSWQATTFLIGEYVEGELRDNPVFTVADGLFWLYQSVERNSIVRKLQVMKLRGQESVPGLHTFRITADGLQTFPRTFGLAGTNQVRSRAGGVFPPASANSTRCWAAASPKATACSWPDLPDRASRYSARNSSPRACATASRGSSPSSRRYRPSTCSGPPSFGFDFDTPQKDGTLKIIYLRPLDLSVDETVHEIVNAVKKIGCKRLVIDSLVGFEMALAPGFRTDFRESLYRMIGALTRLGVTIVSTVEVEENFTSMDLSNFTISFLADDIVRLRYVSINGQLRKMLLVVKMRRSQHSIDMVEYQVTSKGVVIGEPMRGYRALTSGIPGPWSFQSDNIPQPRAEAGGDNPNG